MRAPMIRIDRTARPILGIAALALAAASWSCVPAAAGPALPSGDPSEVIPIPPLPAPPVTVEPMDPDGERGLVFQLEEAPDRMGGTPRDRLAPAARLSAAEASRLLARLPSPAAEPDTVTSPFPPASPPPPRTGATLLAPFPAPDTLAAPRPVETEPGALEVLRILPTGEMGVAPHLSITFSQPMVPLAALGEIAAREVPVRVEPATPGRWAWLDTRTLRFEPDARFPMATLYRVEVPAGVRSELGGTLPAAVVEEFATPAPTAIGGHPHAAGFAPRWQGGRFPPPRPRYGGVSPDGGEPAPLHPVIVVVFDQSVDPAAVLATVRLTADGRQRDVRLATAAEVAADSIARALVAAEEPDRVVALRPARPLPGGAEIRVLVGPGTPSAEGPRTTARPQELRFRTYGPLAVETHGCSGESPRTCWPGGGFWVRFTNPIDMAAWSDDLVRVEPELEDLTIHVSGRQLLLHGRASPLTTYRVTLEPGIRDVFGQTLGTRRTVEFRTTDVSPTLALPGAPLIVLDPLRPPRVAVHTGGHETLRVRVFRVRVDDWDAYQDELERYRRQFMPEPFVPPGREVLDTLITPSPVARSLSETWIDLSPALTDGLGHAVVVVETRATGAAGPPPGRGPRRGPETEMAIAWVQATRIGLGLTVDGQVLQAWATSLVDGAPLPGVRLTLRPSGREAATDAQGLATLPLPGGVGDHMVVARQGGDTALLPENPWGGRGGGGWRLAEARSELRWLVFSDRGLYRPGEQVHLKGWIREALLGRDGGLALPTVDRLRFTATGPRGEEIGAGDLRPGALGGFHAVLGIPREVNTGHANVRFEAPAARNRHGEGYLGFQIHEFRRPEYEVAVDADAGPHVVGKTVDATVRAAYYGGGGLADAPVTWRATARGARFTPPGWDRWHFGRAQFWGWGPHGTMEAGTQTLVAGTDRDGEHHVRVALLEIDPPFTAALRLDAQVEDVDRQAGSGGVDVLVHPALYYAGLRTERSWAQAGDTLTVGVVVVDLDGSPAVGRAVELRLARVEHDVWPRGRGRTQAPPREQPAGDVVCRITSGQDPAECAVVLTEPGPHVVRAEVRDDQGRASRTELPVWVAGPPSRPDVDRPGGAPLELIADRQEYQPGDTARVLLQAPFYPAEGLWTLRRGGLIQTGRFRVDGPSHELRVVIEEGHVPAAHLHVELVGAGPASSPPGAGPGPSPGAGTMADTVPAPGTEYRMGGVALRVPPYSRTLDVRVAPADTVAEPGAASSVTVEVLDARGRPRPGAEVALWMVDEAILALGDYRTPDPIGTFYFDMGGGAQDHALRHFVVRARPDSPEMDQEARAVGLAAGPPPPPPVAGAVAEIQALELAADARMAGEAGPGDRVAIREDFAPLALFEPSLRTGPDGRVTVPVTLPGTLTRYRVIAVAVDGEAHFGQGEATVTARRELMVRLAAPRFLNHGDRVELAVTVQNLTAQALEADVAMRAGGLRFDDGHGRRVVVPAGDRVELRIPATAVRAGPVRIEAVAASGARGDAAALTIPVYEPGTAEAFATYGELDDADLAALPLAVPADALPGFGGLEVTVTSTALHALTDALLFLHAYPYEAPEPVASRLLAVAAVRDVLAAFEAEGLPPTDSILAAAQRDIAELARLQRPDGGWTMWRADRPSQPFVSIHAAHALQRARENGFSVPSPTMDRALEFLRALERRPPADIGERDRHGLAAYALYVRARMGDAGAAAEARRRVAGAGPTGYTAEAGVAAAGWLLHALARDPAAAGEAAELRRQLLNRVTETAAAATFVTSYEERSHLLLHSDRRSDAVALEALIQADPRSDLVPKLARGLLEHRTRGRWRTTQENAWVLLALGRYFQEYERVAPDYATRVWVGDRFAGAHEFRRRTADRWHLVVPLRDLVALDPDRLLVQRDGAGRLYYRAGLRYAPADYALPPLDRGFVVERSYEAVDDPADVRRDHDGAWRIRAGSRVRVRVSMIAPSVRRHVALMDPLPAGLEPINPDLRGTGFDHDPPSPMGDRRDGRPAPPPLPPGHVHEDAVLHVEPGLRGEAAVRGEAGLHREAAVSGTRGGLRIAPPWQFRWFEHQNLRDDRAEAFASLLPAGVYEYTYLARATTHGTFLAAPPRAEEMYAPETFGRGAGDRVIVE
jgi:alpha-2-macroglobulin